MIFTGFKRKSNQIFFNKRLPKLLKKASAVSSQKIKKVLIISDNYLEKELIQNNILEKLKISKNDIEWLFFSQKLKKEQISEDIYTPKDFGWYGNIKSERLKKLLTNKYDLLINYNKIDCLYTNLLILQCKAGFRAGFSHSDNRFYDLLIDCKSEDLNLFTKELEKYLSILNKI